MGQISAVFDKFYYCSSSSSSSSSVFCLLLISSSSSSVFCRDRLCFSVCNAAFCFFICDPSPETWDPSPLHLSPAQLRFAEIHRSSFFSSSLFFLRYQIGILTAWFLLFFALLCKSYCIFFYILHRLLLLFYLNVSFCFTYTFLAFSIRMLKFSFFALITFANMYQLLV